MQYSISLRPISIIFFSLILLCSSGASESYSDEDSGNSYDYANKWHQGTLEAENFLDSFDESLLEEEDYRNNVEAYFFRLLQFYKALDFTTVPERKIEIANKIRSYEIALSQHYNGVKFRSQSLWDSEDELEFIHIDSMISLKKAVKRGAPKPSNEIIQLIQRGGSTGFSLNNYLPPQFFKLPSSFKGVRFLIGGERTNSTEHPDTYILNYDRLKYPDIVGDAQDPTCFICIPSGKFSTIEFDFIDNRVLLNMDVLQECARSISPMGILVFRTQHDSKASYKKMQPAINQAEKNLKSIFIDVTAEPKVDEKWASDIHKFYYCFIARSPKNFLSL